MPKTKFKVRITNLSCEGLPAKNGRSASSKSDPYVKANFDSFKKFKTATIKNDLSPAWDFDLFFYYETMYPRALSRKIFQLQVYDANSFSSDVFIGEAQIDLHTLATGPSTYELPLWDKRVPAGVVKFTLEMHEYSNVVALLKDVFLQNVPGSKPTTQLRVSYSADSKVGFDSETKYNNSNPEWISLERLRVQGTLPELFDAGIRIDVVVDGEVLGATLISLRDHHTWDSVDIPFKKQVGQAVLEGNLQLKNFPKFCQMDRGLYDGSKIRSGHLYAPGVKRPDPNKFDAPSHIQRQRSGRQQQQQHRSQHHPQQQQQQHVVRQPQPSVTRPQVTVVPFNAQPQTAPKSSGKLGTLKCTLHNAKDLVGDMKSVYAFVTMKGEVPLRSPDARVGRGAADFNSVHKVFNVDSFDDTVLQVVVKQKAITGDVVIGLLQKSFVDMLGDIGPNWHRLRHPTNFMQPVGEICVTVHFTPASTNAATAAVSTPTRTVVAPTVVVQEDPVAQYPALVAAPVVVSEPEPVAIVGDVSLEGSAGSNQASAASSASAATVTPGAPITRADVSRVVVCVHGVQGIPSVVMIGKNDLFATLHCGHSDVQTAVHKGAGAKATIDEVFAFCVEGRRDNIVNLAVKHKTMMGSDTIGRLDLDINDLVALHGKGAVEHKLSHSSDYKKNMGSITLTVACQGTAGTTQKAIAGLPSFESKDKVKHAVIVINGLTQANVDHAFVEASYKGEEQQTPVSQDSGDRWDHPMVLKCKPGDFGIVNFTLKKKGTLSTKVLAIKGLELDELALMCGNYNSTVPLWDSNNQTVGVLELSVMLMEALEFGEEEEEEKKEEQNSPSAYPEVDEAKPVPINNLNSCVDTEDIEITTVENMVILIHKVASVKGKQDQYSVRLKMGNNEYQTEKADTEGNLASATSGFVLSMGEQGMKNVIINAELVQNGFMGSKSVGRCGLEFVELLPMHGKGPVPINMISSDNYTDVVGVLTCSVLLQGQQLRASPAVGITGKSEDVQYLLLYLNGMRGMKSNATYHVELSCQGRQYDSIKASGNTVLFGDILLVPVKNGNLGICNLKIKKDGMMSSSTISIVSLEMHEFESMHGTRSKEMELRDPDNWNNVVGVLDIGVRLIGPGFSLNVQQGHARPAAPVVQGPGTLYQPSRVRAPAPQVSAPVASARNKYESYEETMRWGPVTEVSSMRIHVVEVSGLRDVAGSVYVRINNSKEKQKTEERPVGGGQALFEHAFTFEVKSKAVHVEIKQRGYMSSHILAACYVSVKDAYDSVGTKMEVPIRDPETLNAVGTLVCKVTLDGPTWKDVPLSQVEKPKKRESVFQRPAAPTIVSAMGGHSQQQQQRSTAPVSTASASSMAMPEGWVQARDPRSGKAYYQNTITHKTQWTRPVKQVRQTSGFTAPLSGRNTTRPVAVTQPVAAPHVRQHSPTHHNGGHNSSLYRQSNTARSNASGWNCPVCTLLNSDSNDRCAVCRTPNPHSHVNISALRMQHQQQPQLYGQQRTQQVQERKHQIQQRTQQLQQRWQQPQRTQQPLALPFGWVEKFDPRQQRVYYVNLQTHQTTWHRPTR